MVFGRNINGEILTFAPSGLLRHSNLIMWDRETESWWQQGTLEAIAGTMAGTKLEGIPVQVVSFRDFKAAFPNGTVLGGFLAPSNYNPYTYYDSSNSPFLFSGQVDQRLRATERVIGITIRDDVRAYPFQELAESRVVHETVGGRSIVIFYEPTTISTLDESSIPDSRSVGAASVFIPHAGGQDLVFSVTDGALVDRETGSTWDILGNAVDGPLKGERLAPVFHTQSFWFYWAAIHEETTVYSSP